MELFEEALRRWEEALNFRSQLADDEAECSSVKLGAGDAIAEETVEVCDLCLAFSRKIICRFEANVGIRLQ